MLLIEPTIPKILTRLNIFKNFHIFYRKTGLCSSFFLPLKKDLDYSLLEIIMLQDELCEKYSIRKGDKEEEDT